MKEDNFFQDDHIEKIHKRKARRNIVMATIMTIFVAAVLMFTALYYLGEVFQNLCNTTGC